MLRNEYSIQNEIMMITKIKQVLVDKLKEYVTT